jgi:hypothetical protein
VLLEGAANRDHTVQVHETRLISKAFKTASIDLSNVAGALQRPKGMTMNLPIIALQGESGETFGSSQHVQSVTNLGQRETVLPCDI